MRIDAPSIRDEHEALHLIAYHLKMAAALFEATPEVFPHSLFHGEFSESAMLAWTAAMEALYPKEEG